MDSSPIRKASFNPIVGTWSAEKFKNEFSHLTEEEIKYYSGLLGISEKADEASAAAATDNVAKDKKKAEK